jgi:phosphomannomutase
MDRLIFGTDGWRDIIADKFTYANVARAAQAYAEYLGSVGETRVLVGYDTRFNGAGFARRVAEVLAANGLEVLLAQSFLPTPALSFAVRHFQAGGGVMLTASHNPPMYQGFKLKGPYGGSATDAIYQAVAKRVDTIGAIAEYHPRKHDIAHFDIQHSYFAALSELIDVSLLKTFTGTLAHEAMGGAGTGWLTAFFDFIGNPERVIDLHPQPDPLFYGVNPEPIAQNLAAAQDYAKTHELTLLTATDGDADRIGAVLADGTVFNSHQIFAVLLDVLYRKGQSGRVVKTFTVSRIIERLAARRKLAILETPVGFKYITDAMLEGDVLIGGEESGGIGVTGHLPERDGLANSLLLLEAVLASGKSLGELFDALADEADWQHAYDRIDLHLQGNALKDRVMARLSTPPDHFAGRKLESVETLDGVKLNLSGKAWLMFRPSGTEPVLRIYCEAQRQAEVAEILAAAREFVNL